MKITIFTFFAAVMIAHVTVADAQIAAGGAYTLDQTIISAGGGTVSDSGNIYKIEGTAGQSAAGTFAAAGSYSLRSGFWAANPLAPTAAGVIIRGRVTGLSGEALRDVEVVLTGGSYITPRKTRTNSFGSFAFEDVEAGNIYIINVHHRKYGFSQNSQVISLMDGISDLVFQADWEN
ncbi:MAG TPA: carboxypeptidase-like regulatory domain-containing protein [Pyrinomonadaceae bacterium]|jgi:hypothetical protein